MTGKVNPWAEKAFKKLEQKKKEVKGIYAVIEVEPGKAAQVAASVRQLGFPFQGTVNDFVFVDLKEMGDFDRVARLPYVKTVSTQKKLWPAAVGIDDIFKQIAVAEDPLLSELSRSDLKDLGIETKPTAEIPKPLHAILDNLQEVKGMVTDPLTLTIRMLESIPNSFPFPPVLTAKEWKLVTDTRQLMDLPPISDSVISENTMCGVIDSGVSPHPALQKFYEYYNLAIDITPFENMGHGQHVTTCAFGNETSFCRYGVFEPVTDAQKLMHVKVFGAFGPCTSFQIMTAMKLCAERCKVVNMSLGGPLMGSIEDDPECKLLEKLYQQYGTNFIVAAGNDGENGSINSPGVSPYALTVAAIDWHNLEVADFSSRGPSGKYYEENQDLLNTQYRTHGENFLKPDVAGIGVDIVSACVGWYDILGVHDYFGDGYETMSGTSQATPHVAGLIALAIDRGLIRNVNDVKTLMRNSSSEKKTDVGYGLLQLSMLMR